MFSAANIYSFARIERNDGWHYPVWFEFSNGWPRNREDACWSGRVSGNYCGTITGPHITWTESVMGMTLRTDYGAHLQ